METITAAIESAASGDTVLIGPGKYVQGTLEIRRDPHLIGESGPGLATIARERSH